MGKDRILRVIKETFQLEELPEEINQENIEKWDSLGHLQLCMALEKEFGIKFLMSDMPKLTTLEKIQTCLSEMMSS